MGVENFHWKCDIGTCAVLSALEPGFNSHGGPDWRAFWFNANLVSLLVVVVVVVYLVSLLVCLF